MNKTLVRPFAFQAMAKPIGAACNLNCTYCYYLEKQKLYKGSSLRMTEEVLEHFIRSYITAHQAPVVEFVWQGGEPCLAGIDFFRKVVALQQKYASNKQINNSFQTNGTLLTDEWGQFFKQHNFLVGISVDGPEPIHNAFRPMATGKSSFANVMEGIHILHLHGVDFNTLTVVHRQNARHASEIYHFLTSIGSRYLQFIPVVERHKPNSSDTGLLLANPLDVDADITEWSVLPEQFGQFLITIFDEWVRSDVGKVYVQQFDATLANWVGENPGICIYSERCGDAVALEHNGDVYSCDHFVFPPYKLGNITTHTFVEMLKSPEQIRFGANKTNVLPQFCIHCEYRFACHGECPKHRFTQTPDGEPGLNYLCPSYKNFFAHVHPFMQFMADELANKRPPANVMNWARQL
jgi:uncharacterized protein